MPRVGEEQHQAVEAVVRHTAVQHFDGIAVVYTQVLKPLGQYAVEQRTYTRAVHFHTDEVLLRCGSSHFQQGMAHAEADLQGARRDRPNTWS